MGSELFLLVCATLSCFYFAVAAAQTKNVNIPSTRFTCQGRPSGYYADVDTGCQVYHMCDGLGRQFSYTCPNTTLFQQRMLICDHWYMVNCSMSERDYSANLLIGQRDKPFVSDAEMRLRTPRPDILSVPPNSNYYDGLREAESKFPVHPGNSIVGIADSISSANNNGLDSAKHNYRPPSSWSTGTGVHRQNSGVNQNTGVKDQNNGVKDQNSGFHDHNSGANDHNSAIHNQNSGFQSQNQQNTKGNNQRPSRTHTGSNDEEFDNLAGAASLKPTPTFHPTPEDITVTQSTRVPTFTPPTQDLRPPFPPSTTEPPGSEEFNLDVRMKPLADPVYNFIKRFDPNSPDSHKTSMTRSEIININEQLPAGQVSSEEERTPRKNNVGNNLNIVRNEKKGFTQGSRFDTVNTKASNSAEPGTSDTDSRSNIPTPDRELLPPKTDYSEQPSTTMGPPVYYEWKWAAPAFDLEPPKEDNKTSTNSSNNAQGKRNINGRSPFSSVTRPTPADLDPIPPTKNTEYNISSYFVPDYIFPLDKAHPGYDDDGAQTSFQVKVARPGRASYGENPNCPQCHPAYLTPGTCEPCIVKR